MLILDCTLRDGGYYNSWNFPSDLVNNYFIAMSAAGVSVVEVGMRSLINKGFKGAAGYSTDAYLSTLNIPSNLEVAVMVNASELLSHRSINDNLSMLFPLCSADSSINIVRIACHVHEFEKVLPATLWLKDHGYKVIFNLMQIVGRSESEIKALAKVASHYEFDVLYFADSMGSMTPQHCREIIKWLKVYWKGVLGIHTHDNMGLALQNTLAALDEGVLWLDATVTGMGRGPGNARTEELVIEISEYRKSNINLVPLMSIIHNYFELLKNKCRWGSNPYYYLSGKYGIHPTYIQEMLSDSRYDEEDILAVIETLRIEGGKSFSASKLDIARYFYHGESKGHWDPHEQFFGRAVVLLGSGPGVAEHRVALESFIRKENPLVMALNTQSVISADLIDLRVACHPLRLLADGATHAKLPQPLVTPYSMLPEDVKASLGDKLVLDFGLNVQQDTFEFNNVHCTTPTSLVVAYALAIATSGQAQNIYMAGFDGYGADDTRTQEMKDLLEIYQCHGKSLMLSAITPTSYGIQRESIYAL